MKRVFGIRAMSGHTGTDWLTTFRYAAWIREGDHVWMSALSHNTLFQNLESIFTTGLVPGGSSKMHMKSRCLLRAGFLPITTGSEELTKTMIQLLS